VDYSVARRARAEADLSHAEVTPWRRSAPEGPRSISYLPYAVIHHILQGHIESCEVGANSGGGHTAGGARADYLQEGHGKGHIALLSHNRIATTVDIEIYGEFCADGGREDRVGHELGESVHCGGRLSW
jgi:hypothetical protein